MIRFGERRNPLHLFVAIATLVFIGWAGWVYQSSLEYGLFPSSFETRSGGFKVDLPSQWKAVEKSPESFLFTCYQPPSDWVQTTLQFKRLDTDEEVSKFLKTLPEQARKNRTELTLAGMESERLEYESQQRLRNVTVNLRTEVTLVKTERPLVIVMTCEKADWDEYSEDYKSIVDSLVFLR